MNEIERREIREAVEAADEALYHLRRARQYLGSAGNWGLLDIFGGNLLTGLIKHSKMGNAEAEIEAARYALQRFSRELRDVSGYSSIHIGDFMTFADFFFDGFIADIMVQSKISNAKAQCDDAIRRVTAISAQLAAQLN